MSYINPLAGSILGSAQSQRVQAEQKDRQVRRAQDLEKDAALQDEQLEHQVESSEALTGVDEDRDSEQRGGRGKKPAGGKGKEESHLDLRA